MTKVCRTCGEKKSLESFPRRSDSKDGRRNQCKYCKSIDDANRWKNDRERLLLLNKQYKRDNDGRIKHITKIYRENHRESILLAAIKKRATGLGVEFNLTIEDIVIPSRCPLLDIKLTFNGRMNNRDTSPSADRIDPNRGYVKGNVKIISYRANRIKNNATPEELILIAKRITEYSRR